MADAITDRLRGTYSTGPFGKRDFSPYIPPIQIEAADEIERLQGQRARLVEAMSIVVGCWHDDFCFYIAPDKKVTVREIRALIAECREGG